MGSGDAHHEAAQEIRLRQLALPLGGKEAIAEGRGAEVEAERPAADPEVDPLRGEDSAFL